MSRPAGRGSAPNVLVLYATQTGTSQEAAEDFARLLQKNKFPTRLASADEYSIQKLIDERVVIILCSTTGRGEFPDSIKKTWLFLLRSDLPSNSLSSLAFAVFGFGDSSYSRFNFPSKLLHRRLLMLGATALVPRGDGDDQHRYGYLGAFIPWTERLIARLFEVYHISQPAKGAAESGASGPCYRILTGVADFDPKVVEGASFGSGRDVARACRCRVRDNVRLTHSEWTQDVRHISFAVSSLTWKPGDVVYITPQNPEYEARKFLRLLNFDPHTEILEICNDSNAPAIVDVVLPTTLLDLAIGFFDILGKPRRYFFELLSRFALDEDQKERLVHFSTLEGQEELYEYVTEPKRTYLDILEDFASAKPPLEYIFDLFPRLKPRPFSICSSFLHNEYSLDIVVGVVKYRTSIMRIRKGVCSTWLAGLDPRADLRVPLQIKPGTILMPTQLSVPVIMVGTGTGCSAFRAFLQERDQLIRRSSDPTTTLGRCVLYFGCRHEKKDFLYGKEWTEFLERQALSELNVAFSRDKRALKIKKGGSREEYALEQNAKVYVQACMRKDGATIWNMIDTCNAIVFVCGNTKLPADVREALTDIIKEQSGSERSWAHTYLNKLESGNRMFVESW